MFSEVFFVQIDYPMTLEQLAWRLRNPVIRRLMLPTLRVLYLTWLIRIIYWAVCA
jgi:hypothetical protein